jgi:hypothetical protein
VSARSKAAAILTSELEPDDDDLPPGLPVEALLDAIMNPEEPPEDEAEADDG